MGIWETRKATFEKVQEIDAALRFRSLARRNKLIGLWAAEKLGIRGDAAIQYARRLVDAEVGKDDDEALAARLGHELSSLDPPLSAHRIRRRIDEMTVRAAKEIFEGR